MLHILVQVEKYFLYLEKNRVMTQLQKYAWLIETVRAAGKISFEEISSRWERNKELSEYKPLSRTTFNRWRDDIFSQFGVNIACQRAGGYLYYIENTEEIDDDELKKWMLDSFAVGNLIAEYISYKDRILVSQVPSAQPHLTTLLEAIKENRVVEIAYRPFGRERQTFLAEPYCVRLFENRWYVLAHNTQHDKYRIYGLDRVENLELSDETFKLPKDFSATNFFAPYFGIVVDATAEPERIVIRAYRDHIPYMKSLPLHHSQKLLAENEEYADFELRLVPTYDFVMRLLHVGAQIEVISPESLRGTMKKHTSEMYDLYKND